MAGSRLFLLLGFAARCKHLRFNEAPPSKALPEVEATMSKLDAKRVQSEAVRIHEASAA